MAPTNAAEQPRHVRVAIVGAGFSGLGAAIRLRQEGLDRPEDFLVFERADEVGGAWRDNTYPGCRCDVPSLLYSYSFAPDPDWSQSFSTQPEIQRYLVRCADRFGVRPHLRLGTELRTADWDESARRWRLATSRGPYTADVMVAAVGPLSTPRYPDLPGLSSFEGTLFHSARWNHGHDLTGDRVAVIGTGASAIQFIPRIQPAVRSLTVFQRTPPWVLPRRGRDYREVERAVFRRAPVAQRAVRGGIYWARESLALGMLHEPIGRSLQKLAERYLATQVRDPELRAKVTPDYTLGCKRILLSNGYYRALGRPNTEVVTAPITTVTPTGLVTADGTTHEVDTIICGTGFRVLDAPYSARVRGREGRTLAERWAGSPRAHLGTTVAGFPNLFLLLGPNTGLGHTSVVLMAEAQIEYLISALTFLGRTGAAAVEPTPAAQAAFVAEIDRRMRGTVWQSGGCRSWYQDPTGRVAALWPGFTYPFRRRLRRFDPGEYAVIPRPGPHAPTPS